MKLNFKIGEEWKELKKFEKLTIEEKSVVFYAENKASMNHFYQLILELTQKYNISICYITSVKNDKILTEKNENIKAFFIGCGIARTKFFISLKAKILIMDMPDLDIFQIKRSKVFPVHYVYIFHSMFSIHSYLRKKALDNFDTIFCVGEHHEKEIRITEKIYKLKQKQLVKYGFGRLDTLLNERKKAVNSKDDKNLIIITPSYGKDNLLEICGIELIDILLKANFKILLRPHFRILRDSPKLIESIQKKFRDEPNFIFEEGVIPQNQFHNSKCLISDWSGISFEYAFVFEHPVIFIDVPKKVLNPDSGEIGLEPIESSLRNKVGHIIQPKNLKDIVNIINHIDENGEMNEQIKKIRAQTVFNIGESGKIGAKAIIEILEQD